MVEFCAAGRSAVRRGEFRGGWKSAFPGMEVDVEFAHCRLRGFWRQPPSSIMNRHSFLALLLLAAVPAASAKDTETKPVSDKTLSDFQIGEIISGDKADQDSLKGKVVAIEFWGRL